MDPDNLRNLLESLASGAASIDDVLDRMRDLPFADICIAKVDHHRAMRCGFPEVVFCQGKSPDQLRDVGRELLEKGPVLLATRADPAHFQALARVAADARYFEQARLVVVDRRERRPAVGHVVVATGGTADLPVAEEAAVCAEVMGNRVSRLFDVGVAGLHRLLAHQDMLRSARVIVAVAGMEGALPSLVAGLTSVPVVAVPTSVGYGTSFGGVAALLTMLNSCAAGTGVVNIDSGFGAAAFASRINQLAAAEDEAAAASGEADSAPPPDAASEPSP